MITIIAFITMLIDHIWYIFFPAEELWRMIGRIAFPLFAWWIVRGYKMTRSKENYAKRIFFLAAISQIPVLFLFWDQLYNICFTLLFWLLSIFVIESDKIKNIPKILLIAFFLTFSYTFHFDYGIYGILTILLIHRFWQQKKSIVYFALLTFLFYCVDYNTLSFHYSYQLYAIFSFVILYFTPIQKYDFKLNYYVKYGFYPVHLALLYIIHLYW